MSNRECNGDIFTADGVNYYRCFWDGTVTKGLKNGETCPVCHRVIDGHDIGELQTITICVAMPPGHTVGWRLP